MSTTAPSSVTHCTRTSGRQNPSGETRIQSPPGRAIVALMPSPSSTPAVISKYRRGPVGEPSVASSGPRIAVNWYVMTGSRCTRPVSPVGARDPPPVRRQLPYREPHPDGVGEDPNRDADYDQRRANGDTHN